MRRVSERAAQMQSAYTGIDVRKSGELIIDDQTNGHNNSVDGSKKQINFNNTLRSLGSFGSSINSKGGKRAPNYRN